MTPTFPLLGPAPVPWPCSSHNFCWPPALPCLVCSPRCSQSDLSNKQIGSCFFSSSKPLVASHRPRDPVRPLVMVSKALCHKHPPPPAHCLSPRPCGRLLPPAEPSLPPLAMGPSLLSRLSPERDPKVLGEALLGVPWPSHLGAPQRGVPACEKYSVCGVRTERTGGGSHQRPLWACSFTP